MRLKLIISAIIFLNFNLLIAQTHYEMGVKYYQKRAENASGIIAPVENINNSLNYLEKCFGTNEEKKAVELYLKSIYFKSTYCYREGDKMRKEILTNGKKIGKEMVIKHPKSAAIRYWYAVLVGSWAKESGVISAAKEGVIDILKEECETVIKLDPNYNGGSGYLFLGILHLDAPYIPFFLSWPDDEKAVELIEKSLSIKPDQISAQYYLAKALNEIKKKDEAIKILEKVIKQVPNPLMLLEETSELDLCKSLLKDLKK